MMSDYATAGSSSDPTSEHLPSEQLSLLDLPVDVIEEIARRVGKSLCNFALAHPRLAEIVRRLKRQRIEIDHTCENLINSVALNSRNVRALIWMNCYSESSLILSLILKCPNLTELNTVNSGLTTPDLVQSINYLSKLEILKCGFLEAPANAESDSLPDHHNIKSIYVEHDSGSAGFAFLLKLINSCLKIERVYIVDLPLKRRYDFDETMYPPVSRERWQTLQTVILVSFGYTYRYRKLQSLFQNRTASLGVPIEELDSHAVVYDRGNFNMKLQEVIHADESPLLNRTYRAGPTVPVWYHGPPRHLRIEDSQAWNLSGSLPESIASLTTLVELDLSACHSKNKPHIWDPLFQSSTCLESLTIPMCILTIGSCGPDQLENFTFVKALEKLKLKKLLCSSICCYSDGEGIFGDPDSLCYVGELLPDLTGLTHLEELTLIYPVVGMDFLSRIAIRSLVCLRVIERFVDLIRWELQRFFATCTKLRYLKLEFSELPLHEKALWKCLSEANLKQLCLYSHSRKQVDLGMVQSFLPQLCEGLDVFHVHAPELSYSEFGIFLETEIAKMNLKRRCNPLFSIPADFPEYDLEEYRNFPGRGLCCLDISSNFELLGWNIY